MQNDSWARLLAYITALGKPALAPPVGTPRSQRIGCRSRRTGTLLTYTSDGDEAGPTNKSGRRTLLPWHPMDGLERCVASASDWAFKSIFQRLTDVKTLTPIAPFWAAMRPTPR